MSKHSSSSSSPAAWRTIILVAVLVLDAGLAYRMLWGGQSVAAWRVLKGTQADLRVELAALDERRGALSREIRLLQTDDAYVEKMIRQRLNYVRSNETLYLFDPAAPENSTWAGGEADDRSE